MIPFAYWLSLSLLFWFTRNLTADATFLSRPSLRWKYDLPRGSTTTSSREENRITRDNAVVVSHDGSRVFITDADGFLHILRTGDLQRSSYFAPPVLAASVTAGASGVSLRETANGVDFAVYAVMDVLSQTISSRVIAVDKDGTMRWSVSVPGRAVGTPYISGDGSRVYVVHNLVSAIDTIFKEDYGQVSVILTKGSSAQIVASLPRNETSLGPFGPPTFRSVTNGADVTDLLLVAESNSTSLFSGSRGGLHLLVPSSSFDQLQGLGDASYDLRVVSTYPYLSGLRPAISTDGNSCYFAHQGRLSGWDNDRDISGVVSGDTADLFPNWDRVLGSGSSNGM